MPEKRFYGMSGASREGHSKIEEPTTKKGHFYLMEVPA